MPSETGFELFQEHHWGKVLKRLLGRTKTRRFSQRTIGRAANAYCFFFFSSVAFGIPHHPVLNKSTEHKSWIWGLAYISHNPSKQNCTSHSKYFRTTAGELISLEKLRFTLVYGVNIPIDELAWLSSGVHVRRSWFWAIRTNHCYVKRSTECPKGNWLPDYSVYPVVCTEWLNSQHSWRFFLNRANNTEMVESREWYWSGKSMLPHARTLLVRLTVSEF